jgi:hypothetical protein
MSRDLKNVSLHDRNAAIGLDDEVMLVWQLEVKELMKSSLHCRFDFPTIWRSQSPGSCGRLTPEAIHVRLPSVSRS